VPITREIEGPEYFNVAFPDGMTNEVLTHGLFEDVAGNDVTFDNVDFSFSRFVRGYFHGATFVNCRFTGCQFESCNFRRASFSQCDFKYTSFSQTIVPVKEIIVSAPEWPNVRRGLMQILRANAESMGDMEAARAFVREEMKARREHLRRARDQQEEYYIRKYGGFWRQLQVRWEGLLLWLDRNLLGYGEHIGRAVAGTCILLIVVAIVQCVATIDTSTSIGVELWNFWDALRYVAYLLLDMPETAARQPEIIAVIVVVLRYFLLGLLVAALFRTLSHR
jgi:Pentapeptide repeats (9 copies)